MDSLLVGKVASLIGCFATRSFLVNNFHSWRVKSDKTDISERRENGEMAKW